MDRGRSSTRRHERKFKPIPPHSNRRWRVLTPEVPIQPLHCHVTSTDVTRERKVYIEDVGGERREGDSTPSPSSRRNMSEANHKLPNASRNDRRQTNREKRLTSTNSSWQPPARWYSTSSPSQPPARRYGTNSSWQPPARRYINFTEDEEETGAFSPRERTSNQLQKLDHPAGASSRSVQMHQEATMRVVPDPQHLVPFPDRLFARGERKSVNEAANHLPQPLPTNKRPPLPQASSSSSPAAQPNRLTIRDRPSGPTDSSSIPLSRTGKLVIALDCEMVGCLEINLPHGYKGQPKHVTSVNHRTRMKPGPKKKQKPLYREISVAGRCSIVDYDGHTLYDSFINPHRQIISLRTPYSGIRKKDLLGAPTFFEAQSDIMDVLDGYVVVGHAIKNDLDSLELSLPSSSIRDTSQCVHLRQMAGLNVGQLPSLKKLARILLGWNIQKGEHSSLEDARATMELYKVAEIQWEESIRY